MVDLDLDVVVVAYKNEGTVRNLLHSVVRACDGWSVRVILHDNGPDARTAEHARAVAAELGLTLVVQECDINCGFARGCNAAVQVATAATLLFLNPDARLLHIPAQATDALLGAVVLDEDGNQQMTYGTQRRLRDEARLRWARRRPRVPAGTGYVSGACFMIPRGRFIGLGSFDPRYFMYYEDIDLGRRAGAARFPVRLDANLVVVHAGGHSALQESRLRALTASYESGRVYFEGQARAYDALCFVDAVARVVYWLARRRWGVAREWHRLASHIVTGAHRPTP